MWYGSGTGWKNIDGKMEPLYQVKYAHSKDGLSWTQDNVTCIETLHDLEANTRPSVLKTMNGFEMWFSYRHSLNFREGSGGYRIGYAVSQDGLSWKRQEDQAGLDLGTKDWMKNMVAYPSVIQFHGKRIMFFNGDGFGQTGIGYATYLDD